MSTLMIIQFNLVIWNLVILFRWLNSLFLVNSFCSQIRWRSDWWHLESVSLFGGCVLLASYIFIELLLKHLLFKDVIVQATKVLLHFSSRIVLLLRLILLVFTAWNFVQWTICNIDLIYSKLARIFKFICLTHFRCSSRVKHHLWFLNTTHIHRLIGICFIHLSSHTGCCRNRINLLNLRHYGF